MSTARFNLYYNGKNITRNISGHVTAFTYTDKAEGESDELQIDLEDSLDLWKLEWYPQKGDTLTAEISDDNILLPCGTFGIDEIQSAGSKDGDTFSIHALAAGIGKKIRTRKAYAHENKTLREIANTVAASLGYTVQGEIKDIRFGRITQYQETDLKFLARLAYEYGHSFSIRGDKLVFTSIFEIESKKAILTLYRDDLISYSFKDKTAETYTLAKAAYHNPKSKKLVAFNVTENSQVFSRVKVDELQLRGRVENEQQAELKSRVALYRANSKMQEGSISMKGNILCLAGNNLEIAGAGMFSGNYYITTSTHTITRDSGYLTDADIKRVGLVALEKKKGK